MQSMKVHSWKLKQKTSKVTLNWDYFSITMVTEFTVNITEQLPKQIKCECFVNVFLKY